MEEDFGSILLAGAFNWVVTPTYCNLHKTATPLQGSKAQV